jgi:hypothetical protein
MEVVIVGFELVPQLVNRILGLAIAAFEVAQHIFIAAFALPVLWALANSVPIVGAVVLADLCCDQ